MSANVSTQFDKGVHNDTSFDMEFENGVDQKVELDQKMVGSVFQEVMKMFKGEKCGTKGLYFLSCRF